MIKIREQTLSSQGDATFVDLFLTTSKRAPDRTTDGPLRGEAGGGGSPPRPGGVVQPVAATVQRILDSEVKIIDPLSHPGTDYTHPSLHPHKAGRCHAPKEPRAHCTSIV